jgi:hypothetical protein
MNQLAKTIVDDQVLEEFGMSYSIMPQIKV